LLKINRVLFPPKRKILPEMMFKEHAME
jgi:hypothetical protein